MRGTTIRQLTLFCTMLLVSFAAGCATPCGDLAGKICDCQPTRAKQERCKTSVSAANSNTSLSSEENDACQAILDSGRCTCDALNDGDLAACGLGHDALASLSQQLSEFLPTVEPLTETAVEPPAESPEP